MDQLNKRALDDLERLYGVKISDSQRKILMTGKGMLSPLDRQRQFLLMHALAPMACPACSGTTSVFAAAQNRDEDSGHGANDHDYACQICNTKLDYHLALIGGGAWFSIQPGQTVTVR